MNLFANLVASLKNRKPDAPAFIDASDGKITTWKALNNRMIAVAKELDLRNPDKLRPIALLVDRKPDSVAAMLGVISMSCWYVPIDAELSPERISILLSVCEPELIIDCAGSSFETDICPIIHIRDLTVMDFPICEYPEEFYGHRLTNIPMFGIFTSGSTGIPKLVVKNFDAMWSFTEVYCKTFGFTDKEIFGNQIPFYFDASTKDIYSTIYLGATCVIIPQQTFSFPVNLVKILNDYRVSTIVWVPSALGIAAKFNVFSASVPEYLKNVLFVGERMPVKYLNLWIDSLPGCRFVNLYGSTEVAGNSCYYVIDRRFDGADILPIGKAFEGTEVFLIDPETGLEGDEGEIAVAGPGLAEMYYRDFEKTQAAFRLITLPEYKSVTGYGCHEKFCGTAYFSGDFGRRNENGELVCISRRDSQIKHMGHRIELGEIESAASALPCVDEACCFYDAEKEKIILYFSSPADSGSEVRRALAAVLPKYELPHKYIWSEALPHNRNGKIDRAALKQKHGL